jgi:hypothetical protein
MFVVVAKTCCPRIHLLAATHSLRFDDSSYGLRVMARGEEAQVGQYAT